MANWYRRGFGLAIVLFLGGAAIAWLAACDPPRGSSEVNVSSDLGGGGDLAHPSTQSAKAKLPVSGDVVLVGGWSSGNKATATAEFYDPSTKKFNKTGALTTAAGAGIAALIGAGADNGEILAAGGFGGGSKFTKKTV